MDYDAFDIVAVGFSFFSLFTTPIYITLVLLLFKESCVALLDITAALNNFIGVSLPGWGITLSLAEEFGNYYAKIYLFLAWFTRANQGTSSVLIAVNRAYALVYPMKFAMKSPEVNWSHLFQVIPGIAFGFLAAYFHCGYQFFPQRLLRRATPRIEDDNGKNMLYTAAAIIEILQVVVIIICYIMSSIKLLCKPPTVGKKKTGNSAEKSATAMGVCICTMELIYFSYMVFTMIARVPSFHYFSIHSTITDFYSVINCYLILFFSPSVVHNLQYFNGGDIPTKKEECCFL